MNFQEYQEKASSTAIYPEHLTVMYQPGSTQTYNFQCTICGKEMIIETVSPKQTESKEPTDKIQVLQNQVNMIRKRLKLLEEKCDNKFMCIADMLDKMKELFKSL